MELKDRLKHARKAKGLTQKQVTEQIKGLSQSAYSQLESGKSKSTTRAVELAHLFGVDVHWLISGEGEQVHEIVDTVRISMPANDVPLISWVAAGSWSEVSPVTLDDAMGYYPRPRNLSTNGFALKVRGRSMLPEFRPDDIIYVEPNVSTLALKDGDLIVVQCNDDTEATFKQLVLGETESDMYLKPLNPDWPEQRMVPMGECRLVGKVVGKMVEY